MLFYLVAYGFSTIAAFAIVALVRQNGAEATHLSQWAGLGKRPPGRRPATFAFLMLAFAGIPLTSGFVVEVRGLLRGRRLGCATGTVLAVVGVLCSAITVFVYARVIVLMFFSEAPHDEAVEVVTPSALDDVRDRHRHPGHPRARRRAGLAARPRDRASQFVR